MTLNRRQQKTALALLTVAAFVVVGLWGIDTGQRYYMVSEILGDQQNFSGKNLNTMGTIRNGSLIVEPGEISFMLEDIEDNVQAIAVEYTGDLPSNLEEGTDISLSGILETNGIIYASRIVMGCPSRYTE
jgi:cytochrome c-type biogenesis protein CcmE